MAARSVSSMASITRNAVGTEATAPKTSACRRRPSRFARASPPPAMVTARSEITLPGSWRRRRLHIGASAAARAAVSPERSASSASRRLPAWVASPLPSAVTFTAGRHLVAFTWYVPSCLGFWCLDNPIFPGQEGFFADLPPLHWTANEGCGLTTEIAAGIASGDTRLTGVDGPLIEAELDALRGASVSLDTATSGLVVVLELYRRAHARN